MDMTSYIICGHDPQNRKKDNRQKCGDRKRGSLHILHIEIDIYVSVSILRILRISRLLQFYNIVRMPGKFSV